MYMLLGITKHRLESKSVTVTPQENAMTLGEEEWPEDEAAGAVEDFIARYIGCVTAVIYLEREVKYWEKVFESDSLMQRFVTAFNNSKELKEFNEANEVNCKLEWSPIQGVLLQEEPNDSGN